MRYVVAAAFVLAAGAAQAQGYYPNYAPPEQPMPRYNPFTSNWETTYPSSQLNYNPFNSTWQYTDPGAHPQYNPFNSQWEFPH